MDLEPTPPVVAYGVLQRLQTNLQLRSMPTCPGLPVDILTPDLLPVDPEFTWVSPKDDGSRMICFGEYAGRRKQSKQRQVLVHLVDRAMRVFRVGVIPVREGITRGACNFVIGGELLNRCFRIFDVLSYKCKSCLDGMLFPERFRFGVAVLDALGSGVSATLGRTQIEMTLKPFYAHGSLAFVSDPANHAVASDGLVFVNTRYQKCRLLKFKPASHITNDFLLVDNSALYVDGGSGRSLMYVDRVADRLVDPDAEPIVVECRYEFGLPSVDPLPDSPLAKGQWIIVRTREDKGTANNVHVHERNVRLLMSHFTIDDLLANGCSAERMHAAPQASAKTQAYYNPSATARHLSKSMVMKRFHTTEVKDAMYASYLAGDAPSVSVMELGAGRGGDWPRLLKHGGDRLRRVTFVDIDPHGLEEAERRWNTSYGQCLKHRPATDFVELDLSSEYGAAKFADVHDHKYELVSAHFSAHYFLDNLPSVLLPELVADGGVFVCTLFDGRAVREMLGNTPDGKREWTINGELQTSVRFADDSEQAVQVYVDTIGQEIEEPLCDLDSFCRRMEDNGFKLLERRSFESFPSPEFSADHPMRSFSNLYTGVREGAACDALGLSLPQPQIWTIFVIFVFDAKAAKGDVVFF